MSGLGLCTRYLEELSGTCAERAHYVFAVLGGEGTTIVFTALRDYQLNHQLISDDKSPHRIASF